MVSEQEGESLRKAQMESSWAQSGLKALSDQHEILQCELQSLEESLMMKERQAYEQQREMQHLQKRNAILEQQLQSLTDQRLTLDEARGQLRAAELALKNRDAEMTAKLQQKETQIIEFLKAVEAKTVQKDKELADTHVRLARTEQALSKLMREYQDTLSSISSP